uniref:Uncharacterized protein n=1 Tax=Elaeophora elaphi TaxID=1147741 RepID=A0A0R3RZX3_9BILA
MNFFTILRNVENDNRDQQRLLHHNCQMYHSLLMIIVDLDLSLRVNSISMLLNAVHCFIPQLTVLFLLIVESDQNAVDGGDVFAEPQWLPAQIPTDCTSELQRLLVTSAFANTTPVTTTEITVTNVTTMSNTATNSTNNAVKFRNNKNKAWNDELHRKIRANHGNSNTTDATFQPTSGSWNGHSGKRKETQSKKKFHGKIIKNNEIIRLCRIR